MRSIITLFGAAVGIAVFVVLSSISHTVKASLRSVVSAYEGDIVVQSLRAATPPGSRIMLENITALRSIEGVEVVTPVVVGSVKTPWSPFFLVFGIPKAFTARLSLISGRALQDGPAELMIGEETRRAIGVDLGEKVDLAGREFTIVGIYSTGAPLIDGAAVGHLVTIQEMFDQTGFVNLAFIRVRKNTPPNQVIEAVHRMFPRLRATRGADLIGQLQLFRTVDTFTGAISLLALIASCLVVTNTLFMAVLARTREIGILMAVGWSRARIVRSLMTESIVLCALAGGLGNGLAVVFLRTLASSGSTGLGWVPVIVTPVVFWSSLGICGILGLLSSLYPAVVASTLSPAQALRQE